MIGDWKYWSVEFALAGFCAVCATICPWPLSVVPWTCCAFLVFLGLDIIFEWF